MHVVTLKLNSLFWVCHGCAFSNCWFKSFTRVSLFLIAGTLLLRFVPQSPILIEFCSFFNFSFFDGDGGAVWICDRQIPCIVESGDYCLICALNILFFLLKKADLDACRAFHFLLFKCLKTSSHSQYRSNTADILKCQIRMTRLNIF